ncbi:MAG TPA: ABC transporter permease [Gaiellaceae bacterium]
MRADDRPPHGLQALWPSGDLARRNRGIFVAYGIVVMLFAAGTIHSVGYASVTNIRSLAIYASTIGIAAAGQGLCILTGGIDLSIPWTMTGGAVLAAQLSHGKTDRLPEVFLLLAGLAIVVGLVNGLGVAYGRVPPIIMTLGTNGALQGLVLVYTNGGGSAPAPPGLQRWVTTNWLGIPKQVLIWALITIIMSIVLTRGTLGRRLYAIGTNPSAAFLAGNNVRRTLVIPYIVSALCGVLAGILLMAFTGGAYFSLGDPYLFATAAAVAVGGASILGGSGHYLGTVAGALALTLMVSLLTLLNVGQAWLNIAYGLILLGALLVATPRASRR